MTRSLVRGAVMISMLKSFSCNRCGLKFSDTAVRLRYCYSCKKKKKQLTNKKYNQLKKERYHNDVEYRKMVKRNLRRYNALHRERINQRNKERFKERYATDEEYREKINKAARYYARKRQESWNSLSDEEQQQVALRYTKKLLEELRRC